MKRKALLLAYVWPEPMSSAAGVRDQELIALFTELGWDVTVASHSKPNAALATLQAQGIRTQEVELNRSSFDDWLGQEKFAVVVFDRFVTEEQFNARVARNLPAALRILDTQDLHSLRRAREAIIKKGGSIEESVEAGQGLSGPDFLRELASIFRSDLTLVLSDFELELLKNHYSLPPELLAYFPFAQNIPETWPHFSEPEFDFSFLGNFRHPPNLDSILWTVREIWPLIRKEMPQAKLRVMGSYPPREVMALANESSGIIVDGPIEDPVIELGKCAVNLAALRFGAGIKGKICDAWTAGLPTVTTDIGAEGMRLGEAFGGIIENRAHAFALASVGLRNDPLARTNLAELGRRTLQEKFARECQRNLLMGLLEDLGSIEKRRQRNPIGAMLSAEERRASDYFSRWIELKEKKISEL